MTQIKLKLKRKVVAPVKKKPVPQSFLPPPDDDGTDDEQLLRIAKKLRRLARHDLGGLRLHIWNSTSGTQANLNLKRDGSSWSVSQQRSMLNAVEAVLDTKIKVLKL